MNGKELARKNLMELTPYTPGKPIEEVERELGVKNAIKLASNESPYGPSPEALDAIIKTASQANLYPDGNAYYLKEAISEKLGVEINQLTIGNGSNEVIKLISKAYLNPGEEIVMADPSFSEYQAAAIISGAEIKAIPVTEDHKHDLPAMLDAITEKTKLVYICNPNNPTGTIMSKSEIDDFMDKVPDHVIVIMDEAYYEYVSSDEYPDTLEYLKEGKNVIIMRTFSKLYSLAALRIGYAITRPDIADFINRVREPFNVNRIAQAAATASLKSEDYVQKIKESNAVEREYLVSELTDMGFEVNLTHTNFLYFDTKVDSRELSGKMMKKGVIIRSGEIFGTPTYIRLTIGTREQNDKFLQALKESLMELNDITYMVV